MILRILLLCGLALPLVVRAADSYPCENAAEGKGRAHANFVAEVQEALALAQADQVEPALRLLRERAKTPIERSLVDRQLAQLLIARGRGEEAEPLLQALLNNEQLSRATHENVRTALAKLALGRGDYDRVIELLEPVAQANCAPLPEGAAHTLAFAYLQKRQGRAALATLDHAFHPPPPADADWWHGVHAELRCKADGPAACVKQIARIARRGGLSEPLADVLNTLLGKVIDAPEAAESLAAARARGLIDADGKLLPRPVSVVEELTPLTRIAPQYPRRAMRLGINGFVVLHLSVAADGSVIEVEVLDSSPKGEFDESAVAAARKSRFKPKVVDGVAKATWGTYTVYYQMQR